MGHRNKNKDRIKELKRERGYGDRQARIKKKKLQKNQ